MSTSFLTGVELATLSGSDGADVVSGAGNAATGAATSLGLTLNGDSSQDIVSGGSADDTITGGTPGTTRCRAAPVTTR